MTIWLHFITASHDFQAFIGILNSPDRHPGLNWQIIQSIPIQGIGWVFVDPRESLILQRKSWILHLTYHVPNENTFTHAFVWGFRIWRIGSVLHTVCTDPMRIWGPYENLGIRIQESGSRSDLFLYAFFIFKVFLWRVRIQGSGPGFMSHSAALV